MQVRVGSLEATAEIQITKEEKGPVTPGFIRWSGIVPPQKWMNFYTKVLSRFASTPGLKIAVKFEAPAEGDQGKTKVDEARTGLRDLGLNENIDISLTAFLPSCFRLRLLQIGSRDDKYEV